MESRFQYWSANIKSPLSLSSALSDTTRDPSQTLFLLIFHSNVHFIYLYSLFNYNLFSHFIKYSNYFIYYPKKNMGKNDIHTKFITSFTMFLLFFFSTLVNNVASKTYWRDILVLKQLKQAIAINSLSPGSCVSSWDFSYDPCDSLYSDKFTCGFTCDVVVLSHHHNNISRVTELGLDQASYSASLSSVSWHNLSFLRSLDLTGNNFSGSIPNSLSNLTRLTRLTLSHNSLSGPIPDSLGQLGSLEELALDNNALVGPIPKSLSGLTSLKRLEIQRNQLSGEFPVLSRLSTLSSLDCSENSISGKFPVNLPSSLVEVLIRNNKLSGNLEGEAVKNLPFLQVLDLSYNQLDNSVPTSFFTHPSLQQLSISNNNLTSIEVPSGLGTESQLIAVDLSNNGLYGLLPGFMGLMPKLSALNLENNRLMGMIPIQYALKAVFPGPGMAQFERLLLGQNYLFGPIPDPFMRLEPGSTRVSLADNCLLVCPSTLFFCQGGDQKSLEECRNSIGPIIP